MTGELADQASTLKLHNVTCDSQLSPVSSPCLGYQTSQANLDMSFAQGMLNIGQRIGKMLAKIVLNGCSRYTDQVNDWPPNVGIGDCVDWGGMWLGLGEEAWIDSPDESG